MRMGKINYIIGGAGLAVMGAGWAFYGTKFLPPSWSALLIIVGLLATLISLYLSFYSFRTAIARRSFKYGLNAFVVSLIILGIIIIVEAISSRHNKVYDLTENKRYTLAPQSLKLINGLQKNVKITAFFQEAQTGRNKLEDLLKQYVYSSPNVKYEFIDPDRNPGVTKRYKVTSYGTVVVEAGDKEEKVYEISEVALTNAIIKVTREGKKTVYLVTGHGENSLSEAGKDGYSSAKKALEEQNYNVKELLLMRGEKPPEDAAVIAVSGPKKDFFDVELKQLEQYVQRGGKLLFMLDPESPSQLNAFLAKYGFVLGQDVIVDKLSRLFGADYLIPIVSQYEKHPITEKFSVVSFFPLARSVKVAEKLTDGLEGQVLARTGPESWAEKDIAGVKNGSASYDEGVDDKGPVPVAAVVSVKVKDDQSKETAKKPLISKPEEQEKKAQIVVFGDSDFANNGSIGLSGNGDLFLNTISWLAEEENLISIRPKDGQTSPILLTRRQATIMFWLPVVGLPLAVAFVGTGMIVRRRFSS